MKRKRLMSEACKPSKSFNLYLILDPKFEFDCKLSDSSCNQEALSNQKSDDFFGLQKTKNNDVKLD